MVLQNFKFKAYLLLLFLLFLFSGCSASPEPADAIKDEEDAPPEKVTVSLNPAQTYQTIDHFGASDAWAIQFVGNWPDGKRNAIADLLFSTETGPEGDPLGIGLSLWRFNIGAGSARQGEQSGIKDEWRRAGSLPGNDGVFRRENQAGQLWFLQAAKERGVEKLLAFTNSPPVHLTRNGKAYASNGQSNLAPGQYNAFAEYLTGVIQGLRKEGIDIHYISPVNEPQWDWSDGGQEGSPFKNEEISGIVKALNTALEKEGLPTKIDIAEAGKINYLYATEDKPDRGSQVQAFFDPASPYYVGDLSRIGNAISAHSYFTTSPFLEAVEKRKQVSAEIASVNNLQYWMSEYCILGDNSGEIEGNGRDLGMEPALYIARVIHNDLVVSNASAWHWWLAVSPYDYKDGLIYIDKEKTDGNFYDSKMLWALGNFSRFIRPGAVRIEVQSPDLNEKKSSLLVSAYRHPEDGQLVSVIINSGKNPVEIQMDYGDVQVEDIRLYSTSKDENLKAVEGVSGGSFTVAPRSIITVTGRIQ